MNRLLAISDIHGCFLTFYELIVNRLKLTRSDKLILLGDYIDRGPQSREILDFIIDLKSKGYDIVPLLGNHEQMLLDAAKDPGLMPLWLMNSGLSTLESLNAVSPDDIDEKYTGFLRTLGYYAVEGDNIFVHAGFNDLAADPFSEPEGMIWNCRPAYSNPVFKGKRIIHGHRPKSLEHVNSLISSRSSVIPIDTGCVYSDEDGLGNLSALVVNSMELISIRRIDP